MKWTDLKITVPSNDAQQAQDIATGISGGGIYIEDYRDLEEQVLEIAHIDLIEQALLDQNREQVIIHFYLSEEENLAQVAHLLQDRLSRAEISYTLEMDQLSQEDWENSWKQYYHAMEIGKRLAIVPSWETYDTNRTVITLDPGMAFGTGTHETTSLCMETLDAIVQGGERVLDIGTGSGILAITALKLGAHSAQGIDIDPMCVRTAKENALRNEVDQKFEVLIGDLSQKASGVYDIICANIVANAICSLAPCIPALLSENGHFIASGIIDTRKEEVLQTIESAGLTVKTIQEKNGWVALICTH